jgi:hypothetical protein
MNTNTIISVFAFIVLFLTSLFLFIRNYPSDRWFSLAFVVSGGIMLWCAEWVGEGENKIEFFYNKPTTNITDATNEYDKNGSNARQEQERTEGRGERMGEDKGE